MCKVTEDDFIRWYIVAIDDQAKAETAVRDKINTDGQIESKPVPPQVLEFGDLAEGDIWRWMPL